MRNPLLFAKLFDVMKKKTPYKPSEVSNFHFNGIPHHFSAITHICVMVGVKFSVRAIFLAFSNMLQKREV